jgi:hypothetical protein
LQALLAGEDPDVVEPGITFAPQLLGRAAAGPWVVEYREQAMARREHKCVRPIALGVLSRMSHFYLPTDREPVLL